jgi:hypothetical protein
VGATMSTTAGLPRPCRAPGPGMGMSTDPIQLETAEAWSAQDDRRPHMPEPPPVRLLAVADVTLPGVADLEPLHDAFYCGLLKMVRDEPRRQRIYRAANFRLIFELCDRPPEDRPQRPLLVEVDQLGPLLAALTEARLEFEHLRGLLPGQECVLLRDPSGNWVQVSAAGLLG